MTKDKHRVNDKYDCEDSHDASISGTLIGLKLNLWFKFDFKPIDKVYSKELLLKVKYNLPIL